MDHAQPRWRQDIEAFEGVRSTFLLTGNVHDLQLEFDGDTCFADTLDGCLYSLLTSMGFSQVIFYDRVRGFHNEVDPGMANEFLRWAGDPGVKGERGTCDTGPFSSDGSVTFPAAAELISQAMAATSCCSAVVFDLVTSSLSAPDRLTEEEREAMARLLVATKHVQRHTDQNTGKELSNVLILVADKTNDVPSWFYVGNPYVKVVTVSTPTREERLAYAQAYPGRVLADAAELTERESARVMGSLANMTEGFSCLELDGFLAGCSRSGGVASAGLRSAVDRYRYGTSLDYWSHIGPAEIEDAERLLHERIKGQDRAISKAVDILYRASAGLSLSEPSAGSAKPRGVLFLAGPTGTGKTELAKALTEAIFSDESLMVRFDMSEFSEAHSDQRLFGAPPGYVGYDEGGELTGAVRQRPHCLLLFDEVEKAHRTILDKFLQILDDGRLTDSHGETVYFGETVIVFTSNLGMSETDPVTGLRVNEIGPDTFDSPEEFRREVERRIKRALRPEFLNRVGENFVVFDFITPEVAKEIMMSKLRSFSRRLCSTQEVRLAIAEVFLPELSMVVCSELDRGGRGIMNLLQSCVVDPLGRMLVRSSVRAGDVVTIEGFSGVPGNCETGIELITRVSDRVPAGAVSLLD